MNSLSTRCVRLCRGVSLFEVIAVISLMAAFAAISVGVVHSSSRESIKSRAGAEAIVALLRAARQTALGRSTPIEVRRNGPQELEVYGPDIAGGLTVLLLDLDLEPMQAISGNATSVTFLPTGDAATGVDWKIGTGDRVWNLQVYPAGGRIDAKKS